MQRHVRLCTGLVAGALGLFLSASSSQAQNLLTNPDLDLVSTTTQVNPTPTNWLATANRTVSGSFNDGLDSETFANVQQAGGFGVFFKPFQGDTTQTNGKLNASLSQTVGATAGKLYTMTGWAGAGASFIGLTDTSVKATFQIQFLDISSSPIGSPTILDLVASGLGTVNSNPFNYKQYSLSATAPSGTASVMVSADLNNAYNNPAGGDQAFVVDAFSLSVPEPTSLGLIGLAGLGLVSRRRK